MLEKKILYCLISYFIFQEYSLFIFYNLFKKMFGEVFLIKFFYKEQRYVKFYKLLRCKKILNDKKENWENKFLDISDNLFFFLKIGS